MNKVRLPDDRELRCYDTNVEIRGEGESRKIFGYAAKFNVLSRTIGWFKEKISPGAFDDVLEQDVIALFNHNENHILARTLSKTLTIGVDETGLYYEFDAPNTTSGNDLIESVRRGDVQHSSFSFSITPDGDTWTEDEEGNEIRTVKKVKRLYDVAPVVFPAYLDATVGMAKRSYDQWKKDNQPEYDDLQDFEEDLQMRKMLL